MVYQYGGRKEQILESYKTHRKYIHLKQCKKKQHLQNVTKIGMFVFILNLN